MSDNAKGVPAHGVPRWVKVLGVVALVVALALAVLLAGGDHGPGQHAPSAASDAPIPGGPA